jgi:plastocyanin
MPFATLRSPRVTGRRAAASLLLLAFSGTMALAYAQARPQQHIVLIEAVGYSPMTLEVKAGDTVVWKNRDPFPHNVTADNAQFQSGDIAPEKTWEVTLDKRGRFPYVCTLHPGMKGVVTVK